jgi:hypothetical protein
LRCPPSSLLGVVEAVDALGQVHYLLDAAAGIGDAAREPITGALDR